MPVLYRIAIGWILSSAMAACGTNNEDVVLQTADGAATETDSASVNPPVTDAADGSTPDALRSDSAPDDAETGASDVSRPCPLYSTVNFSPTPGTYPAPFTLTMTASPGTTIRYTLDGSIPGRGSPLYSQPVPLPVGHTVVRAKWFSDFVEDRCVGIMLGVYDIQSSGDAGQE